MNTALHEVARTDSEDLAKLLLARGADTSVRDSSGRTALETAEMTGNRQVFELLTSIERK